MFGPKTRYAILICITILALVLAGCAPAAAPTEAPVETQAPAATEAPAMTEAPVMTEAPAETEAPAATEAPTEEPAAEKPTGTLTIALTNDIAGITPSNAPEWQAGLAAAAFFDSFYERSPDGTWEPALIESCTASEDYKTFTFKLKPDLVFHNGEPINADSVIFTYDTLSKATIAYPYPGTDQVTLKKIDDLTVEMVRAEPTPRWCVDAPSDLIPPKYVQEVGLEAFLQKPVGSGAFIVEEWVKGSHVTGVANPNYWRKGYPKVEKVVFKMMPDSSTRIAALKTGEVNVITRLTAEEADTLRGDANFNVIEYAGNRVYYVAFGNLCPTCADSPILKPEVRLAMNYAVDRQTIIDSLFAGKGRVPAGFITPGDIGHDSSLQAYPFDPEQARQMLADAGYPDGFEIDMACPDGAYSHINEVCQAVQGYLQEVGITANVEYMESGKYWDLEGTQGLPPLFVDSWSSNGDPMGRVNGALGKTGAYRSWNEDAIQTLIDKINATGDATEVKSLYFELQKFMYEQPPFIYLYEPYYFEATSANVVDYAPYSNEYFQTWKISLK